MECWMSSHWLTRRGVNTPVISQRESPGTLRREEGRLRPPGNIILIYWRLGVTLPWIEQQIAPERKQEMNQILRPKLSSLISEVVTAPTNPEAEKVPLVMAERRSLSKTRAPEPQNILSSFGSFFLLT